MKKSPPLPLDSSSGSTTWIPTASRSETSLNCVQSRKPQTLLGAVVETAASAAQTTAGGTQQTLIVEGVGGLLVPLREDYSVCDFAVALGLPVLIAARPGLGTINHTLLTLRVARDAGLDVRAVVLTPWPHDPSALERSNRDTIARVGEVEVELLSEVAGPQSSELALAGEELPWRRWLTPNA